MAKINIQFNNTTYAIDESELTPAIDELQTHLSTVINGSGAVINVGDTDYNIDATKLSTATSDFVAYLGTISGTGSKVIIDGVEYSIDSTKVQSAISEFQTTLDNMGEIEERLEGDGSEYFTLAPTALSFRATAPLDTLQEIQINGQTVDPANYTLTEGSTIVTFPIDYLKTLEKGNYEVGVVSQGQSAKGDFTVVDPDLNEYGFYYNQPYGAYVEMFGSYAAFFLREDGTVDVMDTSSDLPATLTYTIDGNNIAIDSPMGIWTGTISSEGWYCNELETMFVLGNHLIVADEDYIYRYSEEQGGYTVIAIDRHKFSYGPIKTGINGYDTVALDRLAFGENANLMHAPYIPNSVRSIGYEAFFECNALRSVTIPNSVRSIGSIAFLGCESLENITIPEGVTNIDNGTFKRCTSLTSITIPDSVTSIGMDAFCECTKLVSVVMGNSVGSIGTSAFAECNSLESITIPDSVTSIEYLAFADCTKLKNATIGNGVTSIGEYAFSGCSSLTSITIPDSVTSIGENAFRDCTNLHFNEYDNAYYLGNENNKYVILVKVKSKEDITSCSVNPSVKFIYDRAFSMCINLTSVIVSDGVVGIGFGAFQHCWDLTSITIPISIASIGADAFWNCSGLANITFEGTTTQWRTISKGTTWNYNVPATYVQCSDGQVAL